MGPLPGRAARHKGLFPAGGRDQREAARRDSTRGSRTSRWRPWPRPGRSTASTRYSTPSSTIEEDGQSAVIDSLFKTYIVGSTNTIRKAKGKKDFCLSVFKDNAGIIEFNEKYNLAFKVETHNTPSALDPYGGALTGIVGVNRDPFGTGKGARLLFNTDVFCFAPPDYKGAIPPRLLHPRRVLDGVREGVEHGGNKSGIPTVNGSLVFDESFLGKPLVYCGTCGIMPAVINGEPSHEKKRGNGRSHRHVRRTDRQGRHPRRHLLIRGTVRGIADERRPDRRPDHPEKDDRFPSRRAG